MSRWSRRLAILFVALCLTSLAHAAQVGYYLAGPCAPTSMQVNTQISATGHTPVNISVVSPASLAPLSVLAVFLCDTSGYAALAPADLATISTAANGGLKVLFFDHFVTPAVTVIPGAGAVTFIRLPAADIEPLGANPITAI